MKTVARIAIILLLIHHINHSHEIIEIISSSKIESVTEDRLSQIPTISEIQKLVGAEVDGRLGPETIRLWEEAICNQEAKKYNYLYKEKE